MPENQGRHQQGKTISYFQEGANIIGGYGECENRIVLESVEGETRHADVQQVQQGHA
jgi:hypothetical protein